MDCRQFLDELSNLMDHEVAGAVKEALEEHVALCHDCQVVFNSTRRTVEIVANSSAYELPQDVSVRLLTKLRSKLKQVP